MRHPVRLIALVGACLALGACGSPDAAPVAGADAPGGLRVAAAFYPLEEIARAVGGGRAAVTGLTPPGSGPHDLELRAPQVVAVERADVIVFLGAGFQPAVEKLVAQRGREVIAVDMLDEVKLRGVDAAVPGVRGEVDGEVLDGDRDPHVWVDPARYAELVDAVERAFSAADPGGSATYARNTAAYRAKVLALDAQFDRALKDCRTRTITVAQVVACGRRPFVGFARRPGREDPGRRPGAFASRPGRPRTSRDRRALRWAGPARVHRPRDRPAGRRAAARRTADRRRRADHAVAA